MKLNSKKLALTGILLSLSLIIGTIENYLPPIIPGLPFVKIGFSNVVITFSLLTCGLMPTLIIGITKSILVPLFVGNPMMIAFSLSATLVCILVSYALLKTKKVAIITVGIISAITHNLIQLCVASLIMTDSSVFGFLPYLIITGFLAGLVTGLITYLVVKYLPKELLTCD